MTGNDYNVALMVFFVPYVLCEVPSNIVLAKFKRPSYYMGILILCWGTVMTLMGTVQNFAGLCATRFFLALFKAGKMLHVQISCETYTDFGSAPSRLLSRRDFSSRAVVSAGAYPVSYGVILLCVCAVGRV